MHIKILKVNLIKSFYFLSFLGGSSLIMMPSAKAGNAYFFDNRVNPYSLSKPVSVKDIIKNQSIFDKFRAHLKGEFHLKIQSEGAPIQKLGGHPGTLIYRLKTETHQSKPTKKGKVWDVTGQYLDKQVKIENCLIIAKVKLAFLPVMNFPDNNPALNTKFTNAKANYKYGIFFIRMPEETKDNFQAINFGGHIADVWREQAKAIKNINPYYEQVSLYPEPFSGYNRRTVMSRNLFNPVAWHDILGANGTPVADIKAGVNKYTTEWLNADMKFQQGPVMTGALSVQNRLQTFPLSVESQSQPSDSVLIELDVNHLLFAFVKDQTRNLDYIVSPVLDGFWATEKSIEKEQQNGDVVPFTAEDFSSKVKTVYPTSWSEELINKYALELALDLYERFRNFVQLHLTWVRQNRCFTDYFKECVQQNGPWMYINGIRKPIRPDDETLALEASYSLEPEPQYHFNGETGIRVHAVMKPVKSGDANNYYWPDVNSRRWPDITTVYPVE
jgi:hypothetical protein